MANNENVRVNLQFKGDISDVEKKLQQLQTTLAGITSGKKLNNLAFGTELNKAINDATKLQAILKNTTMANGNLDLTKFRSELQKSGLTVKDLGNSLLSLGPQGSQAFSQLTQSIISAEIPLKRTSTLLSNFATTLKNTAKWQISSTILHGFMSSVSQAYGYAQDLNESLNNIRIVSKQNTDQMADFAKEANKAAKELSVTTTAYTDAALIFYQQGLTGTDVTERTDVVAKMSNVTRDSVDEVSSYMTAIWNNFDDGSQSLEHYADVITGLGAATASSSAEIAAGLEKFAAVADTVGLSYDYATSALATVVAQTRQSADTVGTAFKTLFARIEGLKLGETLEDGVDLNKYSQALAKIGVSVLDANGQLRDMDSILDDMGAKWGQISKAQQVALAQTVAGTRQYNQLVALMDNWDKVQNNLQIARSSDGELQAQADIYAESWEAAQKRVRAAWESIYSSLFDDKLFIKLTNGVGSFVESLDKVIQGLGGLKGLLPIVSAGLLNLFNKELADGINNFIYNLQIGTKATQENLINFKEQVAYAFKDFTMTDSLSSGAEADAMANKATLQQAILDRDKQLIANGQEKTEIEKTINQFLVERVSLVNQNMVAAAQEVENLESQLQLSQQRVQKIAGSDDIDITDEIEELQELQTQYGSLTEQYKIFIDTFVDQGGEQAIPILQKIQKQAQELGFEVGEDTEAFKRFNEIIDSVNNKESLEKQILAVSKYGEAIEDLGTTAIQKFDSIIAKIEANGEATKEDIAEMERYLELIKELNATKIKHAGAKFTAESITKEAVNIAKNGPNNNIVQPLDIGADFANATKSVMSFGSALRSLDGLFNTLTNDEVTFKEALLTTLTSGSMAIMMLTSGFKSVQSIITPIANNISLLTSGTTEVVANLNSVSAAEAKVTELEIARDAIQNNTTASMLAQVEVNKALVELDAAEATLEAGQTLEEATQADIKAIQTAYDKKQIGFLTAILSLNGLITEENKATVLEAEKKLILDKKDLMVEKAKFALQVATNPVLLATLAIVGAIAFAYVKIAKDAETAATAAKKNADEHKHFTDELQEESEKVSELKRNYDEIYDKYKNHTLIKEDFRQQSLALVTQYGNEADALLILAGAYDEFQEKLEKAQKQKDNEFVESAKQDVENYTDSLNKSKTSYQMKHPFSNTDFVIHNITKKDRASAKALSDEGLVYGDLDDAFTTPLLNTEEILSRLMKDESGEFRQYLEDMAEKNTAVKAYLKFLEEEDEYVKNLQESYSQLKEASLNQGFNEVFDSKEIGKNLDKYNEIFNKFKNLDSIKVLDLDDNELKDYFNSLAVGYEDTAALVSSMDLAEILLGSNTQLDENAIQTALDELTQILLEYSDSERAYIYLHPTIAGDTKEELDKFLKDTEGIRKYDEQKRKFDTAGNLLNSYTSKEKGSKEGQLTEEQRQAAKNDLGIEIGGKTDRQIMEEVVETYKEAAKTVNEYYTEADAAAEKYAQNQRERFGKEQQRIDVNGSVIYATASADKNTYEDTVNNATSEAFDSRTKKDNQKLISDAFNGKIIKDESEQVEFLTENYIKLAEKREDGVELSEKEEKTLNQLEAALDETGGSIDKNTGYYEGTGKQISKTIKQHKNYIKACEEVEEIENSVQKVTEDLSNELKTYQQDLVDLNNEVDNLQKAYKSMESAQKEYAEQGWLSVDTVQSLISLGPQYLKYLTFEDGQIKINTEGLQNEMLAEYDLIEAKQADILMTQMAILMDTNADETKKQEIITMYNQAIAQGVVNGGLAEFVAKAQAAINAGNRYKGTLEGMINYANTLSATLDAGRKGVKTNFSKAMATGSGSGGSKKSKETKDLKEYADEFDRFYPFQKVIDDLADAISDLAKEQEHMAGGELVGALHKQNRLLQEQKKAYQELAKKQKKYQKEMQADLAKYGMSFDIASGNIVNYAQSTQAMLDQYNAAIEKYNKSAQSDADKKALEAVEKEYEKFKKLVSNYQGILTEIQDTENNLDDIYYETIANNLKEFEIMVQVKLDIGEAQRMVNDFISKINKNFKTLRKSTEEWMDVFETALKNAHTYIDGDLGTINVDLDAINKVKNAIDSGDYGHEGAMFASESEAITKYKELVEQLKEDANDLYELYKQAWEDYLDAIDESIEAWEDLLKEFDNIDDTLNHYEKLVELIHGYGDSDKGYQALLEIYSKQIVLNTERIKTVNAEVAALEKEKQELLELGAKETDKDIQKINEAIKDGIKTINESREAYLEALNKSFELQFEKANKNAINQALGFDIDKLTEQWDKAKKAEQGYYDENERIYQLDKIRSKYNEAINKTTDIKLQQKLAKMRDEELKDLEEKKRLSEGDLEIAEKKLAVEQAEIALKEAQDNKSQMRLQRDSQGNWSYQFVADEDNIADKQQALIDASYELYETVKKNEQDIIENLRTWWTEWYEERNNLSRENFETQEEYEKALAELDEYYSGQILDRVDTLNGYRNEQAQATAELLLVSYEKDTENYENMTEEQKSLVDELRDQYIEDMAEIATASDEEYEKIREKAEEVNKQSIEWWDSLEKVCEVDLDKMNQANQEFADFFMNLLDEYQNRLNELSEIGCLDLNNIEDAARAVGDEIDEVTDKVQNCIDISDALSDFRERLNEIEEAWYSVKDSIEDALESLRSYLEKLLEVKEMQDVVKQNATDAAAGDMGKGVDTGGNGGNGGSDGGGSQNKEKKVQSVEGPILDSTPGSPNTIYKFIVYSTSGNQKSFRRNSYNAAIEEMRQYQVGSVIPFKTGGYTGSWNDMGLDSDRGKLAVLHQKELILNQTDTRNILDAVQMVRDMNNNSNSNFANYLADVICQGTDNVARMLEEGIHYVAESMTSATYQLAQVIRDSESRQLEQNVHIEASFPNARNSREIEDAFNNLVNIASQRTGLRML